MIIDIENSTHTHGTYVLPNKTHGTDVCVTKIKFCNHNNIYIIKKKWNETKDNMLLIKHRKIMWNMDYWNQYIVLN